MLQTTSAKTAAYAAPAPRRAPAVAAGHEPLEVSARDALVAAHLPQVKYLAERLAARLPPSVDRDDLIGAGVEGLLDAVEKFDPDRGVLFKTYAETRVRGAMLDSLRALDWAPRSLRQRAREIEETYRRVEQEHGRRAGSDEIAAALGLSLTEFHVLLGELRGLTVLNFDADEDERELATQARQVPGDPAQLPSALFESSEMRERLASAIESLPERERRLVALYYLEELTMKEVGAVLGVTESRVSQIHTQAVIRLRAGMSPIPSAPAQRA